LARLARRSRQSVSTGCTSNSATSGSSRPRGHRSLYRTCGRNPVAAGTAWRVAGTSSWREPPGLGSGRGAAPARRGQRAHRCSTHADNALSLWNDPDGTRLRETYFAQYPGV
jgi:hypothetical protein